MTFAHSLAHNPLPSSMPAMVGRVFPTIPFPHFWLFCFSLRHLKEYFPPIFLDSHSVSDESNRNVKQEVLALYESEKLLPSSSFGGNPPKL